MRPTRIIHAVDVHAEGEPGRVLFGSHAYAPGASVAERFDYAVANLEGLRTFLLREPRGYPALCANLIVPASHPEADFGMIVLEQGGFKPMSGSNTICAVTAALETGFIPITGPITTVVIETAVGLVRVQAHCEGAKVVRVTLTNVPCYVVALDHRLAVPEYGEIDVDVVFGGQFYVQARAADLGVELISENAPAITRAAMAMLAASREQLPAVHPENPSITGPSLPMLYGPTDSGGAHGRNAVVLPTGTLDAANPLTWSGVIDRSPCGTGTSGRMAARHARGEQAVGEEFVHESLIGTRFIGILAETTEVAGIPAVVPTISGQGWITALTQLVLDESDPFPTGYTVGDIWGAE